MNQVEVKVVNLQILECPKKGRLDVFRSVICVPKFRYNKKIFSLDESVVDCSGNSFASLLFVTIVTS